MLKFQIVFSAKDPYRLVTEAPFSRFTESIRALKLAADLQGGRGLPKVIGLTSSVPGEGKSTIAVALAGHIAHVGQWVILVDCDLRNPAVSWSLAPDTNIGILEVISGHSSLEDVASLHAVLRYFCQMAARCAVRSPRPTARSSRTSNTLSSR
jgi:Mrp family chromosome partitioning ATPase